MSDNPSVNEPSSGTYGELASLNRLKKALPEGRAVVGQPEPAGATPPPMGGSPFPQPQPPQGRPTTGAAVPPGLPSVLAAPTQRPDVPMTTPLAQPAPAPATAAQGRLALLQTLSQSPEASATTREWANEMLTLLIGGRGTILA